MNQDCAVSINSLGVGLPELDRGLAAADALIADLERALLAAIGADADTILSPES